MNNGFIRFADLPPNPLDQEALREYQEMGMNVCLLYVLIPVLEKVGFVRFVLKLFVLYMMIMLLKLALVLLVLNIKNVVLLPSMILFL